MISVTLTDADIASAQPLDVLSTTVRTKFKVTNDQNTLKLEKMNSTSVEDALVHFTQHLESMKDWPDKAIIMELTGITERNIDFAFNFVNIIVSRLMSSQTHSSYKLPMFYLVDSIMKNVGGPFAALFGKHFYDIFGVTISGIHDTDRKKLDFLIGTWEERKILPADLLLLMRQTVHKPLVAHV